MSEQPRCDDDLSNSTQNTLPVNPIYRQDENGKSDKKKQKRQNEIEDAEEGHSRFNPLDMKSLTFKPIGSEQEVSVWQAEPLVFHAYVSQFIRSFRNVNVTIWPLADRLTLVNVMWTFCKLGSHDFPFTLQHHLAPNRADAPVPDSAVSEDTSPSQAS